MSSYQEGFEDAQDLYIIQMLTWSKSLVTHLTIPRDQCLDHIAKKYIYFVVNDYLITFWKFPAIFHGFEKPDHYLSSKQ